MYKIKTYNKISKTGLEAFDDKYTVGDEVENADGAIVRSAALHDVEFPASLKAIARAGAGTNSAVIGRANLGPQISLLRWNADESWCFVEFNGLQGWIAKQFILPIK